MYGHIKQDGRVHLMSNKLNADISWYEYWYGTPTSDDIRNWIFTSRTETFNQACTLVVGQTDIYTADKAAKQFYDSLYYKSYELLPLDYWELFIED